MKKKNLKQISLIISVKAASLALIRSVKKENNTFENIITVRILN